MHYLVLGLGLSGQGALRYLLEKKQKVAAFDHFRRPNQNLLAEGLLFIEKEEDIPWEKIHTLIISPGIDPSLSIVQTAKTKNIEIIGEIELVLRDCNNTCIGITGTNGKTTIASLIAHVLNSTDHKALALGNIGRPLSLAAMKQEEILVIELSSFQLETMKSSKLDMAVISNIYEDHLDRYSDFASYIIAKCNIQNCLKKNAPLFISSSTYAEYKHYLPYPDISFVEEDRRLENPVTFTENLSFAFAVCRRFGVSLQNFMKGVSTYKPHLHRLELVGEINKIRFYNDSKATNIEAVMYAVNKLQKNIILIAGGKNKGFSFGKWRLLKNSVICIIAIGETKEKIKEELKEFSVLCVSSLEEAVKKAYGIAKPDDNILLSPGCSSYDQFDNYEHRGKAFVSYVNQLQKGD